MTARPAPVDVATIGETMVAFVGRSGSREFLAVPAGAESNVAVGLAALGHATRWVSRLGDDHLGRLLAEEIAGRGVDVAVEWDLDHPTGIMTKHVGDDVTDRTYYRSGSAASRLSPADLGRVGPARWIHVTGITPALATGAADLVRTIADDARTHGAKVSFDVNLRPVLWDGPDRAARTIVDVARRADLVFIGDDEARTLLGTDDADELAAQILRRDDQELVLKRGAGPATSITRTTATTVPTRPATVVEVTGAGDAFAAGCLAGRCRAWPPAARLRLGHLLASRVIAGVEDVVPPFEPAELAALTPEELERRWAEPV